MAKVTARPSSRSMGAGGCGPREAVARSLGFLGVCLLAFGLLACSSGNRRPQQSRQVTPVVRDVPAVLRTAVGAQATLVGIDPVLVTGYGFVVGLKGTGGKPLPPDVAGSMEREMALRGVGRGSAGADIGLTAPDGLGITPRELLSHPDTAVVVVYALIPPGAPNGMTFDVFVQALNADSLQGGVLWTTDLRFGPAQPFGGVQARKIANARGAVFVNPFASGANASASRTDIGRVIEGGLITEALKIEIALDNPSHTRARGITQAINSRFPQRPEDRARAAMGRDDSSISLTIPDRFRDNPSDFVRMVQHMPTNIGIPAEEQARRLVDALKEEPGLSEEIYWSLRSLGEPAINQVRDLYTFPEIMARRTAIRAGVHLGDPLVSPIILEQAVTGSVAQRVEAIRLAGLLPRSTRTDAALRELVDDREVSIRVAAYEALAERARNERIRYLRESNAQRAAEGGAPLSDEEIRIRAKLWFSDRTSQGIRRRLSSGKFLVDQLPSSRPMIYATQQNEPRLAILGENLEVRGPLFVSLWDDRVTFNIADGAQQLRVRLRRSDTGRAFWQDAPNIVDELIDFLSHLPTAEDPRPGLGLSYSEVVGALHALWRVGSIEGSFITEQDRLLADLIQASRGSVTPDRPERPGEEPSLPFPLPELPDIESQPGEPAPFRPRLVPLDGSTTTGSAGSR